MSQSTKMTGLRRLAMIAGVIMIAAALGIVSAYFIERGSRFSPGEEAAVTEIPDPDDQVPLAPIGDSRAAQTVRAVIYVADSNYLSLVSTVQQLTLNVDQTIEEAVVNAVLEMPTTENHAAVGGGDIRALSVESSMGVATVDLSVDTRRLDAERLHILRAALTNSLLELSSVTHVNVLVNGRDEGLVQLPSGTLGRFGNDLTATWLQVLAEEQKYSDGLSALSELRRDATIYYASNDYSCLLPEVHRLRITGGDYLGAVLREMMAGPSNSLLYGRLLPTGVECIRRAPDIVTTYDGSKIATLSFNSHFTDYLERNGIPQLLACGAIVRTVCGFVPEIDGVLIDVEGITVTELFDASGSAVMSFDSGIMLRGDFDSYIGATATLFYPLTDGRALVKVRVPVSRHSIGNPRALLDLLMQRPSRDQTRLSVTGAWPEGITDADILGVRLEKNQVLINLSGELYKKCQDMSAERVRAMVYSIVNTMCQLNGVKSVRLYFDGERVDTLGGALFVKGPLMSNPGLVLTQK